jgi:mono/diheme cytochrome c family protein
MSKLAIAAIALFVAAPSAAWAADGAEIFKAQCAKCHGDTGHSDTPSGKKMKVPPLAGDAKVAAQELAEIEKEILENKKHPKKIKGMDAGDVAAVATFVKKLAAGN